MTDVRPVTAKAEWHLSYRCSLRCTCCSRASWLNPPHTEDMTLDDAREWCRQADEIGWKRFQPEREKARIIMIGGEPTLHPQFLDFIRLAREWSGTYVQVYSNAYTPRTRELVAIAEKREHASIERSTEKPRGSVGGPEDYPGWWLYEYVSPADAGLPSAPCYCHPSQICGLGIDHEGYGMCPIGTSLRALLGLPRTRRFADLFDPDIAARMTREECEHCGYEINKRQPALHSSDVEKYMTYAESQPMVDGVRMSPTWQRAFAQRGMVA